MTLYNSGLGAGLFNLLRKTSNFLTVQNQTLKEHFLVFPMQMNIFLGFEKRYYDQG